MSRFRDFDLQVKVVSSTATDTYSTTGLMMREELHPISRSLALHVFAASPTIFSVRGNQCLNAYSAATHEPNAAEPVTRPNHSDESLPDIDVGGWSAIPGQHYRMQSKESLDDPDWTDMPGEIVANGATASKAVSIGVQAQGFYRVVIEPQNLPIATFLLLGAGGPWPAR